MMITGHLQLLNHLNLFYLFIYLLIIYLWLTLRHCPSLTDYTVANGTITNW